MGHIFFTFVDSHSQVVGRGDNVQYHICKNTDRLRNIFSHYGLPEHLVSDNDPQFVSFEFKQFMKENEIRHILIAPGHPQSNGQAEPFIATFKQAMKARSFNRSQPGSIRQKLIRFLLRYRTMRSTVTGMTPAELFIKRRIRTRLDLLRPSLERTTSLSREA